MIGARREESLPVVAKLITLLSRVIGHENDAKYRREFTSFIATVSSRRPIRWAGIISDALSYQLAYFGSSKTFYMNSYLVFLLLHGKTRSKELADERHLGQKYVPVWRAYQKWWYQNKFQYFYERSNH